MKKDDDEKDVTLIMSRLSCHAHHVTSVGQRKKKSPRQDTQDTQDTHRSDGLTTELATIDSWETRLHILGSYNNNDNNNNNNDDNNIKIPNLLLITKLTKKS